MWVGGGITGMGEIPILGVKKKGIDRVIRDIFRSGDQGFFYDPNDLSTMFQGADGTIPVTGAEQPVGLILDKSKGLLLGNELVTNSWTPNAATITYSSNSLTFLNADVATNLANNTGSIVVGKWYKGGFTVSDFVSGGVSFSVNSSSQGTVAYSNGTYSFIFQATKTGILQLRARVGNTTLKVSNITLKELAGNHAYQTTSSMRPVLSDTPRRIDFDGIDDKLVTKPQATLTNATIVRAVPNVGAQILTNQTIPATYEDNTDHCGLIVINRALTPIETSVIATEFNKRAGV